MTSWMVPSPPQANTVSLPAATANRAFMVASWLERQTVNSVRTPADWMIPMARSNSTSRRRRPEFGLKRIVAFCMRRSLHLSLAHAPLPHSESRFLRDGMSNLPRQHGDLSAMVSVVRDQIAKEGGYVRAKALDHAVA